MKELREMDDDEFANMADWSLSDFWTLCLPHVILKKQARHYIRVSGTLIKLVLFPSL